MTGIEALIESIHHAEASRDKADKAMHRFIRGSRLDGEALKEINSAMASLRVHLAEVARLANA